MQDGDTGRVAEVTDPAGLVSRSYVDAAGRTTRSIENWVDGVVSDGDDKSTSYTFNGAGMTSLTAHQTGGGVQTTEWVYGVTQSGSAIASNDIVGATKWPDPSTGAASGSEQETTTVNALGQTLTMTDRNGNVHTLTYDVLGRVTVDTVTTLGSGVDGGVRRIVTAYDGQGNAYLITSYDATSSGNVVNQIQRAFNGLGQMITEWQQHGATVNTSTSPKVQYAYSEMASGANHSRLTSITYPSGYVLTFNYASGLNQDVSRLSSLSDSSGTVESYDYLGFGTVVRRGHSQPGVDLTFIKQSGESNGDAGDQYTGLDRFGRVVDQRWIKTSGPTTTDRFQYGYDRDSNRLWRDNLVNTAMGELYGYDNLNQLTAFDRGTLNGGKTGLTGSASRSQDFDFDALGNWESFTNDGGSPQTRTHNAQNEITGVSGATTPLFDANGNMTQAETGLRYVYDAWNRLVAIKDSPGTTTLKTYSYDGLNRRVTETASSVTTDLFYSDQWQVLEEKVASNTSKRYVWSPVYVDAMILRDRDTDANGTLDERLWVHHDANFNVTALVDGSGNVVERYAYDPFGAVTVHDASYNVRSGGSNYAWQYLHQGGRYDSVSGLYHFRNRDYSPTLGRWVSLDPIQFAGGDVNLFSVGNRVINAVDPLGLDLVILYDAEALTLGHGHVALLIGNDKDGWYYFSFAPTSGPALIVKGSSPCKQDDFHHLYRSPFKKLMAGYEPLLRRYEYAYRFASTAEQDKKAIEDAMKWKDRDYTWESNCVNQCDSALQTIGLALPIRMVGSNHSYQTAGATLIQTWLQMVDPRYAVPIPPFFGRTPNFSPYVDFDKIPSPANTLAELDEHPLQGQVYSGPFFVPPTGFLGYVGLAMQSAVEGLPGK